MYSLTIRLVTAGITLALAPVTIQAEVQTQAQTQTQEQTQTAYGWQLMSEQERMEYRQKMRAMKTNEERQQFRLEHHKEMQIRAKERGVTLPEEPLGPGPGGGGRGMGPGGGMGGGMGPGGGGGMGGGRQ